MADETIRFLLQTVALVAGLPLLGLGLWWTWRRWSLRRDGLRAVVLLIGYQTSRDIDDSGDWHHPIVALSGQNHVLTMGERRQRWPVGSHLTVCYRPQHMERMVIDRVGMLFSMPLIIALTGAGLIGLTWL